MRTRVKICGITRTEDALAAARCGADAIGFVFCGSSPRHIGIDQARAIADALPPFVTKVGLFVDAAPEQVRETLKRAGLDLLQFHGEESAEFCGSFAWPYVKALRMRPGVDVRAAAKTHARASGLLLDSYVPQQSGGSGQTFDWAQVPQDLGKPVILAGGLTAANVTAAIAAVHPYAVDVSSGVEQEKGIKDAAKVAAFIDEVNMSS